VPLHPAEEEAADLLGVDAPQKSTRLRRRRRTSAA
jgi:hypothetical protein